MNHDVLGNNPSPTERLTELLPMVAENFTPQLGYRVELSDIPLADLDIETDYKRQFEALTAHALLDTARLVYTYNPLEDTIDLESIRLGLATRLQDTKGVIADCVYLQRYRDGFIQSVGLGQETLADTPIMPLHHAESSISNLLEKVGLYQLPSGAALQASVAEKLSNSDYWTVREQQAIALPPDTQGMPYELLVVRTRSVVPGTSDERALYTDDYEVTFQVIQPTASSNTHHIQEASLMVRENDMTGRSLLVVEREYDRYENPFVVGLTDITNTQETGGYEPSETEIDYYVKVLENFAA